jgi:hypothetical protein
MPVSCDHGDGAAVHRHDHVLESGRARLLRPAGGLRPEPDGRFGDYHPGGAGTRRHDGAALVEDGDRGDVRGDVEQLADGFVDGQGVLPGVLVPPYTTPPGSCLTPRRW